jgi:NADPH:quinone reductase
MKDWLTDKQRYGESIRRWPEEKARIWGELMPLMETGKIRPNVMKCYEGLESVPAALADMANRKISGKAVVRVAQERALDIARSNL